MPYSWPFKTSTSSVVCSLGLQLIPQPNVNTVETSADINYEVHCNRALIIFLEWGIFASDVDLMINKHKFLVSLKK